MFKIYHLLGHSTKRFRLHTVNRRVPDAAWAKVRPLLAGIDAFDLLEALRLRELPIIPVAALVRL